MIGDQGHLPPEPSHHIGVQAHCELLLDRPIKRIADGVFPKALFERRNVWKVCLRIRPRSELGQLAPAGWRHSVVSQVLRTSLLITLSLLSGWLGAPRWVGLLRPDRSTRTVCATSSTVALRQGRGSPQRRAWSWHRVSAGWSAHSPVPPRT